MRIVINADDFGMCDDTVAATIACFDKGAITSATIMARMPSTDAALDFARAHPEFSFGVHLTFCADSDGIERPLCDPADVAALVGNDGHFLPTTAVRVKGITGRVPVAQIERETSAQLARVRDAGIPISHVDAHSHLHKIGPFRAALERVLPRFGVTRVRNVQNLFLRTPFLNVTYWLGGPWRHRVMASFDTTHDFYMPSSGLDVAWAGALLARLPETGTLEVGVHPGSIEGWRRHERDDAMAFAPLARNAGHTLHTWHDVLER